MTHPGDCHGMLIELCPLEMAGDLRIRPGWSPDVWRDEHPLGVTGLHNLSVAVRDLEAAGAWLTELLSSTARYREVRPGVDAEALAVPVAGVDVELVQPRSAGSPIADYIGRYGQRLRSIEFGVLDVERARAHLEGCGLRVVEGSRPVRSPSTNATTGACDGSSPPRPRVDTERGRRMVRDLGSEAWSVRTDVLELNDLDHMVAEARAGRRRDATAGKRRRH
jgi:catechol 2,3-dioxygenase-like lactoylglutathione lyase family enzyme